MDEITKLKAEVYDLLAQQQRVSELLQEKNRQIMELFKKSKDGEDKKDG